jgi:hypothetical protein
VAGPMAEKWFEVCVLDRSTAAYGPVRRTERYFSMIQTGDLRRALLVAKGMAKPTGGMVWIQRYMRPATRARRMT